MDRFLFLDPEPPRVVCQCEYCHEEVYEGDDVYNIDGEIIHEDCFVDYCRDVYADRLEVAEVA